MKMFLVTDHLNAVSAEKFKYLNFGLVIWEVS